MTRPATSRPRWWLHWPGRGGPALASAALHLCALVWLSPSAAPPAPTRSVGSAVALRVQVVAAAAAPAQARVAPPAAVAVSLPRPVPAVLATAAPSAQTPAALPAADPDPVTAAAPRSPADTAPQAPPAVSGNVFALPTLAGFGGGVWRLRGAGQGAAAGRPDSTTDLAAALPWQQAQQAQQWQQTQAQAVHLQQAWVALQAQLAQWPAPVDTDLPSCALPRTQAPSAAACTAWSMQPGWPALLAAAQAFYQLAPVGGDLVLASADAGYRLERRP